MSQPTQICKKCVMDSTVPFISFDMDGVCNYCKLHEDLDRQHPSGIEGEKILSNLIYRIKKEGSNKKYDCVIGISGGTDSTYTLYLVKKLGLRPLAVHYDNGWNTETSVNNIQMALSKMGVDLYTFVENWEEFKEFQKSFLRASTPEIDVPTDERIKYVLIETAAKHGIKYILDGRCYKTEGKIPPLWSYADVRYVNYIKKRFSKKPIHTIKTFSIFNKFYYGIIKHIKIIHILNFMDYNKEEAKRIIQKELEWKDYGGHHFENTYTRFSYSYYLPIKFNIDKRKTHLSAQVRSGQITRDFAIIELAKPPITNEQAMEDKKYIAGKLDLSIEEFNEIINSAPKYFIDYPNNFKFVYTFRKPIIYIYRKLFGTVPYTLSLMENFTDLKI